MSGPLTPEELEAGTRPWLLAAQEYGPQSLPAAVLRPDRDRWIRLAVHVGMTHRAVAEIVGGAPNGLLTGERVRQICNDTERTR